jgi:hypothetical protein
MFTRETRTTLAPPLAAAFLAGGWSQAALVRRGRAALEGPSRWLPRLVREVLAGYPRPPRDRLRELVAYVGIVLAELPDSRAPAPTVRRHHLPVAETVVARWPVPRLDTLADLAGWLGLTDGEPAWFADARGLGRRVPETGPLRHYRYAFVPRRTGPPRLLEAPKPRLKVVQRRILHGILDHVPVHPAAHGFTRGRSAVTNATAHVGRVVVVSLDLRNFFTAVEAGRVHGVFRTAGYPEAVAHTLTRLCTTTTPPATRRRTDDPLRAALARPHLPQGAPTSPALANLAAYRLDARLTGLAAACRACYTRYADDLTFSGDVPGTVPRLLHATRAIARDEGFSLHEAKTRYSTAAGRQRVTGVVVNVRTNAPREEYDALKALLHDAALHGPAAANRAGVADLRAHVLGRVAWVAALNPARGARLRERVDAVAWG